MSQTCRPERVPFGNEAARGVHDVLAAIGAVALLDQLTALALGAQPERLVRDELVARKAVVLGDADSKQRAKSWTYEATR